MLIGNLEKTDDFNDGEKDELFDICLCKGKQVCGCASKKVNSLECIYDEKFSLQYGKFYLCLRK
ncbi:MAG: hypothetical protein L6V93_05200 [Clostridiales bacterium]|nr:MAG: hypothetical protein L6V93_05200 [Clostridiales bacterium]